MRSQLLVADVQDNDARLVNAETGACLASIGLPGRPRWCMHDGPRERFLANIREPAYVVGLAANTLQPVSRIEGLPSGPHGLDLDRTGECAFVACDAGVVVVLDLTTDREIARVPIAGEPDAIAQAARDRLYVAIGQPGVVDVLDGRTLSVVEQVTAALGEFLKAAAAQEHSAS